MRRIAVVIGAIAAGLLASGCNPRVTLNVGPDTDLLDGNEVFVHGIGYAPEASIRVVQCPTGADAMDDCNGDSARIAAANSFGTLNTTAFVDATFENGHGELVDCLEPEACVVVSVPTDRFEVLATTPPLSFSGRDGLTVDPRRDLGERQVVHVQGRTSAGSVKIMQCMASPVDYESNCEMRTVSYPEVDADGFFSTDLTVYGTIHLTGGGSVACTQPGYCIIAADVGAGWEITSPQWAPIAFRR